MRFSVHSSWLLTVASCLLASNLGHAQETITTPIVARAQEYLPEDPVIWLPLGHDRMDSTGGFYTFGQFLLFTTNRPLGEQTVAFRGFVDSLGLFSGIPGLYIGSGVEALNTRDLGRQTFAPGYEVGLGYRLRNGTAIYLSYWHIFDFRYDAHATLVPPFFRSAIDLSDTYLVSGVFNFPIEYSGPIDDIPGLPPGSTYGVWNAAEAMDITYTQRYDQVEFGARIPGACFTIPGYESNNGYVRSYSLAGGRFAWFWERFRWRTVDYDVTGAASELDQAYYTNIISNRMYGPFIGCGIETYLGGGLSLSGELTGATLLNIAKQRAKYERADRRTQSKRARTDYTIVPEIAGNINLTWAPIEAVQMRIGYNFLGFFNTITSREPIDFNFGGIDPPYERSIFRYLHGLNVGIGLTF